MVRILHAADFHLDSSFGALTEEQSKQRRQESRALVEELVTYANENAVDLLLLPGDLLDSERIYAQTTERLTAALARFRGQVVIAPGNHDAYCIGGVYDRIVWSDNVHLFTADRMECLEFPQYGCRVYGAAFTGLASHRSSLPVGLEEDGWVHLGVYHGDVSKSDTPYRPITPEEIAQSGLHYLALGHVHSFGGVQYAGKTAYAYSGCLEGHGFDECGEKGFLLGEVSCERAELRFVPFAKRRYRMIEMDIENPVPPEHTEEDICRITLTGETEKPVALSYLQRKLEPYFYHLELRDATRLRQELWAHCGEDSLRGLFLQELHRRYEQAEDTERDTIEMAVRFGLAAMDNREM